MKSFVFFIIGFISGILFLIVIGLASSYANDTGKTFYEAPGDCITTEKLQVIQDIGGGYALAIERKRGFSLDELVVLIENEDKNDFYDDQIIKVPAGKCMRQIGIYKYRSKGDEDKTVPIVRLMDN